MEKKRTWARGLLWLGVPILIGLVALARSLWAGDEGGPGGGARSRGPIPVAVAPVVQGPLDDVRVFTATLEASAQVVVAAQVAGTVGVVHVDLADVVEPEQLLAEIDDREMRQQEAAARAALAVSRARASAAASAVQTAARALERTRILHERGIASERELDAAQATMTSAESLAEVANAEVSQARAAHGAARLTLSRTEIRGQWSASAGPRRVSARHVDEGARVSVGDPLFTLVDVDPLVIVAMVSAGDYERLSPGQRVTLQTSEVVEGRVARISPSFDPASRQARVEIEIENPDARLQPGMFVRARSVLAHRDAATLVPEAAVVSRGGQQVVFLISEGADTVIMTEVETGLRADGQVEVLTEGLSGRVVTLGHQRLEDGAAVRVTEADAPEREPGS